MERRSRRAREEVASDAAPRLRRAMPRVAEALTGRRGSVPRAGAPATFAGLYGGVLRGQTRALREVITAVAGAGDAAGLESARHEARRLRELVAPLRSAGAGRRRGDRGARGRSARRSRRGTPRSPPRAAVEGGLLEARAEEVRRGEALAGLRPGLLALLRIAEQRGAAAERDLAVHLGDEARPR